MVEVLNSICRLDITGVVLACHISIIYSIICLLYAKGSSAGGLQVVRSSLLPGILKTMGHNKDSPRPIKVLSVH
jgi:hypothetical protein